MVTFSSAITSLSIAVVSMLSNPSTIVNNQIITQSENFEAINFEKIFDLDLLTKNNETIPTEETIIRVDPVATSKDSDMPYYVKVNISQNVVNVYKKDENGDYSIVEKVMLCSTGKSTPKAGKKYKLTSYRTTWNALKGNVYGQYAVQITR